MNATPLGESHVHLLLGAYVLGVLTPEEDEQVSGHLPQCEECTLDCLELSDTTALLAMTSEADLLADPDRPDESGGR